MVFKFFTTYNNRPSAVAEVNSGKRITQTAGYIPFDKQIRSMLDAGQRLDAFRKGQFGSTDGTEPDVDPTSKYDFDHFEASRIVRDLRAKAVLPKKRQDGAKNPLPVPSQKPSGDVPPSVDTPPIGAV